MEGCQHSHDDPLVIRVVVANKIVHRVLVDNGSSTDIIFTSAFDKMGIKTRTGQRPPTGILRRKSATPRVNTTSAHFGRSPVLGHNDGKIPHSVLSAYNILLGRPSLNVIRVVPSAYHMVIKFPTANGVGMVQGDQRVARECYSASMKQQVLGSIYMK